MTADLLKEPVFLFGLVVFVAGVGAVAVKAFGVEISAVTPARSGMVAAVGAAIMVVAGFAVDSKQFEVTDVELQWDNVAALQCDSVQGFHGAIVTRGEPRTLTYRIVAGNTVIFEQSFKPESDGRVPVKGGVRVHPGLLPGGDPGVRLRIDVIAPEEVSSSDVMLGSMLDCGSLIADPLPG